MGAGSEWLREKKKGNSGDFLGVTIVGGHFTEGRKMKKSGLLFILFMLFVLLPCDVEAKSVKYEKEFKERLLADDVKKQGIDKNGDGKLTQKEMDAVTEFTVGTDGGHHDSDHVILYLADLKYFKNLKTIKLYERVYSLKPLYQMKKIQELEVCGRVTVKKSIDFRKFPGLRKLKVYDNNIGNRMNLKKNNKLEELICPGCHLTKLNLRNNKRLRKVDCSKNKLTSIEISSLNRLQSLNCRDNQLKHLQFSSKAEIREVDCSSNRIESFSGLNVRKLERFDCYKNNLRELDFSNASELKEVRGGENVLNKVNFSGAKALKSVELESNNGVSCQLILPYGFAGNKFGDEFVVEYAK